MTHIFCRLQLKQVTESFRIYVHRIDNITITGDRRLQQFSQTNLKQYFILFYPNFQRLQIDVKN